jgi:DNA repair protein RadD
MYREFIRTAYVVNPRVRVIGFTATPYRLTTGLICGPDNILNHICFEVGVRELIDGGYLCPLVSKQGASIDTSGLHKRGGEFIGGEAADLMDTDERVRAACAEIVERTLGRNSVLVFASGVEHGERLATELHARGCNTVATIFGDTETSERADTIARFKSGALKYLVNMNVLTTGFDAPNVDCVALVRPTASPGLYYQMVGRGFRKSPNKTDCLVLDFGGNIEQHGPIDAINVKTREGGDGEPPVRACPQCKSFVPIAVLICQDCGFEFPKPEAKGHEVEASAAPILSDSKPQRMTVSMIRYSLHKKRDAEPNAIPTLRVAYYPGGSLIGGEVSEYIPLHKSFGQRWWKERGGPDISDASEALAFANSGGLRKPVAVMWKPEGKFRNVCGYEWAEAPDPTPRISLQDAIEKHKKTYNGFGDPPYMKAFRERWQLPTDLPF